MKAIKGEYLDVLFQKEAEIERLTAALAEWRDYWGCESPHDTEADKSSQLGKEQARANTAENKLARTAAALSEAEQKWELSNEAHLKTISEARENLRVKDQATEELWQQIAAEKSRADAENSKLSGVMTRWHEEIARRERADKALDWVLGHPSHYHNGQLRIEIGELSVYEELPTKREQVYAAIRAAREGK